MAENKTTRRFVRSLDRAFKVDQAINYPTKDFVIIRFGDAADKVCKEIDEWIEEDAAGVNKFARIYKVENKGVPELVTRYSLSDNCSIIFFHGGTVGYRLPTANIKGERRKFRDLAYDICEKIRKAKKQRPRDWLTLSESYVLCNPVASFSNPIAPFGAAPFSAPFGGPKLFGAEPFGAAPFSAPFGGPAPFGAAPFSGPFGSSEPFGGAPFSAPFGGAAPFSAAPFGNPVAPLVGGNLKFCFGAAPFGAAPFGNPVVPSGNSPDESVGET